MGSGRSSYADASSASGTKRWRGTVRIASRTRGSRIPRAAIWRSTMSFRFFCMGSAGPWQPPAWRTTIAASAAAAAAPRGWCSCTHLILSCDLPRGRPPLAQVALQRVFEHERHRAEPDLHVERGKKRRAEDAVLDPVRLFLHDDVLEPDHVGRDTHRHVRDLGPRHARLSDPLEGDRVRRLRFEEVRLSQPAARDHRRLRPGVEEEERPRLPVERGAHHGFHPPEKEILVLRAAQDAPVEPSRLEEAVFELDSPVEFLHEMDAEDSVQAEDSGRCRLERERAVRDVRQREIADAHGIDPAEAHREVRFVQTLRHGRGARDERHAEAGRRALRQQRQRRARVEDHLLRGTPVHAHGDAQEIWPPEPDGKREAFSRCRAAVEHAGGLRLHEDEPAVRHAFALALRHAPPAARGGEVSFPVRGLRQEPREVRAVRRAARARQSAFEPRRGAVKVTALEKHLAGQPVEADRVEALAARSGEKLGDLGDVPALELLFGVVGAHEPDRKSPYEPVRQDRDITRERAGRDSERHHDEGSSAKSHASDTTRAMSTVWSSYCATPVVKSLTAPKMRRESSAGGCARPSTANAVRRSMPNSSSAPFSASVIPSEYRRSVSPGAIWITACVCVTPGIIPTGTPPLGSSVTPPGETQSPGLWPAFTYVSVPFAGS